MVMMTNDRSEVSGTKSFHSTSYHGDSDLGIEGVAGKHVKPWTLLYRAEEKHFQGFSEQITSAASQKYRE